MTVSRDDIRETMKRVDDDGAARGKYAARYAGQGRFPTHIKDVMAIEDQKFLDAVNSEAVTAKDA